MRRVPIPSSLVNAARLAAQFDRTKADPWTGVRAATGIAITLVVGRLTGHTVAGVTATIGSLSSGFASHQGTYRSKVEVVMASAAAMAVCAFLGIMTGHLVPLFVAVTIVVALVAGLLVSLGPAALVVGIQGVVGLVVFSQFSFPATVAARDAGLVLLGGAVQALVVMATWPARRFPAERRLLSRAYASLADFARAGPEEELPSPAAFEPLRQLAADHQPFGGERGRRYLNLLADAERLRLELVARPASRNEQTARTLDHLGLEVAAGRLPDRGDLAGHSARQRTPARSWWAEQSATVRSNVTLKSAAFRHALRLAATLAAADVLSRMMPYDHRYWMPMTAMLVLRPDFSSTVSRGLSRVAGTLVGAGLVTLVLAEVRPGPDWLIAIVIGLSVLAVSIVLANYAIFSVFIASLVVTLLAFTGEPELATAGARSIYTLAGSALAMAAYLLWPTWEGNYLPATLADLAAAQARWTDAVLTGDRKVQQARLEARLARANAEAAIARWQAEPSRGLALAPALALEDAQRFVSHCRACARVISALQLATAAGLDPAQPELAEASQALGEVTAELREGRVPGREARARLAEAFEDVVKVMDGAPRQAGGRRAS